MSDFEFDFSSIQDDLQVDPESYPEQSIGPRPPLPGNYKATAFGVGWKKNRTTGELTLWKGQYPVLTVQGVEIVEPLDNARRVVVFHDIPTMPFERDGKKASRVADVLRSLDATVVASGSDQVLQATVERLKAGMDFRLRLDYRSYDSAYAKAEIAKIPASLSREEMFKARDQVYKKAQIRGYRNIEKSNRQNNQAKLGNSQWYGPSGNICEVQPYISAFYPATENVSLGPDKALLKQ